MTLFDAIERFMYRRWLRGELVRLAESCVGDMDDVDLLIACNGLDRRDPHQRAIRTMVRAMIPALKTAGVLAGEHTGPIIHRRKATR